VAAIPARGRTLENPLENDSTQRALRRPRGREARSCTKYSAVPCITTLRDVIERYNTFQRPDLDEHQKNELRNT
jgi:hypothetical protein